MNGVGEAEGSYTCTNHQMLSRVFDGDFPAFVDERFESGSKSYLSMSTLHAQDRTTINETTSSVCIELWRIIT